MCCSCLLSRFYNIGFPRGTAHRGVGREIAPGAEMEPWHKLMQASTYESIEVCHGTIDSLYRHFDMMKV